MELNPETEEFKRSELLGKYTARILFGWDNKNLNAVIATTSYKD